MGRHLVALHGFTQTHHHVHDLAFAVARRAGFDTVSLPDLPGHGLSSADRSDFDAAATALTGLCGSGTYVGYSMGGRFALAAAALDPDRVERLVLIGATAGIEDPDEAEQRRLADRARADDLDARGVEAFLADWLALPMFAGLPDDAAAREHRLRNTAAGLAHSLRTAGTGSMTSRWQRLGGITAPTLVVAGERDTKFAAVGRRLTELLPDARLALVADAGHAAHTEQPTATADAVVAWLDDAAG